MSRAKKGGGGRAITTKAAVYADQRAPGSRDQWLQKMMEFSSEWYWEQDESYRFTLIKGGDLQRAGIDPNTYLGAARWDHGAVPVGDDESWGRHKAVLDARLPFTDFLYKRTDAKGESRSIVASGEPVFDDGGRFRGYRGIAKDVTQSKRAEALRTLERSVAHWISEAESVTAAVTTVIRVVCETEGWECGRYFRPDERGGILRFGESWGVPEPAIQQFIQRSREITYKAGVGLMGRVWQSGEALWCADATTDPRAIRSAFTIDLGLHGAFVFPVISEGKTIGVLAFNTRQVREPEEQLLQAIGAIGTHIGQFLHRKRVEEEQQRFRAAMDASADLMLLVDRASMRYLDVNHAACRALGYTREELLSMGPQDIFSKSREELVRIYDGMFDGTLIEPMVEGLYRCKDGSRLLIEAHPRAVRSASGDIVISIARAVGERRRADQLLKLEHTVTRALAESVSASATLKAAIRAICETEGWECGRYLRLDEGADVMRFSEAWTEPNSDIQRYIEQSRDMTYGRGVGLVGRVWQSGEPLWVSDITNDTRVARTALARETGMRGAFAVPVMSEGKIVGVLIFHSREIRQPDERLLQAVRVIGTQIGQFVQRKQAEEVLRESEERFRAVVDSANEGILIYARARRVIGGNAAAERIIGLPLADIIGAAGFTSLLPCVREDGSPLPPEERPTYITVATGSPQAGRVFGIKRPDGSLTWVSVNTGFLRRPGDPDHYGVVSTIGDITERKQNEARIRFLANHDALTSLPNRTMFGEVLNIAIQSARRYHRAFAVLFIDLDRFKIVNDTLGHEAGDQLLREMATRLSDTVRASDVVARLGGDEFVVLVQEVSESKQVEAVARKILSALIKPMLIQGQECRVTASIGICMYPADAQDEQALMKSADIAMYRAKESGKNTYKFHSEETNVHAFERLALETSLRRALEREEFFLHYQAKVDLRTMHITGVEALVRWQHPDLGMVPPGQFIPLAEETGLIVPLGQWVLNAACAQNVAWQREGLPPLRMAVNLSARQLADEHLLGHIADALEKSGMKPELLELELTESMVMQNAERAEKVLIAVKKLGVRLAIDDFGVGYSSLTHLKRFPIDTLKVDRSFINHIPQDSEDKAITEAIIAMGKSLKLTVVAEGVETLAQQTFLQDLQCDEMQGFYFSRPIKSDEFAKLLRQRLASQGE